MKISVLVPVYNVEAYLCACIDSVLQQTYQNFELVLVDDGSTDSSGTICDQYRLQYPQQIKVIHKKNGGLVSARITGISEATGDILIFLDSDDSIRRDALEHIAFYFREKNCDMLIYNAEETPAYPSRSVRHPFHHGQTFCGDDKQQIYRSLVLGTVPNAIWLKAVRAKCVHIPQRFMEYRVLYGEDLLFTACFLQNCEKIVCICDGLYYYRMRQGSAVNAINIDTINTSVKIVHTELEKYLVSWGGPELSSLHNARKVKSWMYNLQVLLNTKKHTDKKQFKNHLSSMARDPYFCDAYLHMDNSLLSWYDSVLAWCLHKKLFVLVLMLHTVKVLLKKTK